MLDRARPQSLAFAGWVQHDVAQRALAQVGLDLDALTRAAGRRDFRPVSTGIHAALEIASAPRHVQSDNVVAKLPGSAVRLVAASGHISAAFYSKRVRARARHRPD